MRRVLGLTAAVLLCLLPATADAGTVSMAPRDDDAYMRAFTLSYDASAGEANKVTVKWSESRNVVTIKDDGAKVTVDATGICEATDAHIVRCRAPKKDDDRYTVIDTVDVDLGDKDDTFTGATTDVGSTLVEKVTAGPGKDTLEGGDGDDTFTDGGPLGERDVYTNIEDDEGLDVVTYGGRKKPLKITPETAEDKLGDGIDVLEGGDGDDRMTGNDDRQSYAGGAGDDLLAGNGGNDVLRGGPGNDTIDGGDGKDLLFPDGGRDDLACGEGEDTVADGIPEALIPADCEKARWGSGAVLRVTPQPLAVARRTVKFRIGCPHFATADFEPEPCSGEFVLRSISGKLLGGRAFKGDFLDGPFKLNVPLTPAGRRAAAKGQVVQVKMTGSPQLRVGAWRFRLRR